MTIAPGESITWTNSDTVDHQVSSTKASLASPVLHAGQTFSFKFATAGNFAITDLLVKKLKSGHGLRQDRPCAAQTVSLADLVEPYDLQRLGHPLGCRLQPCRRTRR